MYFCCEEIIECYNSNGSAVFLVEYCTLFQLLVDRNMCPMSFIYVYSPATEGEMEWYL
jgi:hypothetical protein